MYDMAITLRFLRQHILLTLFFSFLILCLFFGDGPQLLIDTVGAAGVMVVSLYTLFFLTKQRPFPLVPAVCWGTALSYMGIRTFFSDDIGYSFFIVVRWVECFLIYYLFFTYSSEEDHRVLPHYIVGFSLISLCVSLLFLSWLSLSDTLPYTNLLVPSYGHNNIVDILLFGIPVVFFQIILGKSRWSLIFFGAMMLGLLCSFARASMMLISVFMGVATHYFWNTIARKKRCIILWSLCVVTIASVTLLCVPQQTYARYISSFITPKMVKSTESIQNRFEYIRQAWMSIRKRPLFGSGPGTFILASRRFQSAPTLYSRHAHNFFIEQVVETGIVGCILLYSLVVYPLFFLIKNWKSHNDKGWRDRAIGIYSGIGLVILYSCTDFNLSFLVVSLLFWGIVGTFSYEADERRTYRIWDTLLVSVSIIVLGVFYFFSFGSNIPGIRDLTPFRFFSLLREIDSIELLEKKPVTEIQSSLPFIRLVHKKNSEVFFAYAKRIQGDEVYAWYPMVLSWDPKNVSLYRTYLHSLYEQKNAEELEQVFLQMMTALAPTALSASLTYSSFFPYHLLWSDWADIIRLIPDGTVTRRDLSSILYLFGYIRLETNPDKTKTLWNAAKTISPEIGVLYQELAALAWYFFHDTLSAQHYIEECKKNDEAWEHCRQIHVPGFENLSSPGTLKDIILETTGKK